ncbi:MAG TPA: hypothetical protein VL282_10575 [Tepidisphaeraceae bacterium]|nr:hypothetical protein [Tepidisphaeraceae bacterium]
MTVCVLGMLIMGRAIGAQSLPTTQEVFASNQDLWGEAALKHPDGPTYEFFEKLLPPLRYVDANFRCYPIVLCPPSSKAKARLVSDGSSVNARARSLTWSKEQGTPAFFFMGEKREAFGSDLAQLQGPKFVDGYLPIVQMTYATQGSVWEQESFCSADPALAENGAVFVKFTLKSAHPQPRLEPKMRPERDRGPVKGVENAENLKLISEPYDDKVEAWFEGPALYKLQDNRLMAPAASEEESLAQLKTGNKSESPAAAPRVSVLAMVYPGWINNPGRGAVIAPMKIGESAYIVIFTKNADPSKLMLKLTAEEYDKQRALCAKTWNDLLDRGAKFQTPEAVVNNAWRSETIMNFMLISGDAMHYSACNQYDGIYIGEGGDSIYALGLYGFHDDAQRLMPAQFKAQRKGLEFHRAAFKLQMLAKCYQLHPDAEYLKKIEPMWQKEIKIILDGREKDSGMLPKEQYAGDVHTFVYSMNSNSNCWRALRDMSIVLADLEREGEAPAEPSSSSGTKAARQEPRPPKNTYAQQAEELAKVAEEYRKVILDALAKSIDRQVDPPFVPVALNGEEDPHSPIWASTMGGYWNLMIHYILGSGVFTAASDTANDVLRYVESNGGVCMGLLRARVNPGNWWIIGPRANDLYGLRRNVALLERDEVDRALVGFYGKLAQGMTRDTFIGCEGSSLVPFDQFGRQMSLPPNSTANANYLQTLRYMLVQDLDTNDDGRADTLRLAFATPRAWLSDGKTIKVENAPTNFGPVSYTITSKLKGGTIDAQITLPPKAPQKISLRLRLPRNQKLASATAGDKQLKIDNGETIDLSGLTGNVSIQAKVNP